MAKTFWRYQTAPNSRVYLDLEEDVPRKKWEEFDDCLAMLHRVDTHIGTSSPPVCDTLLRRLEYQAQKFPCVQPFVQLRVQIERARRRLFLIPQQPQEEKSELHGLLPFDWFFGALIKRCFRSPPDTVETNFEGTLIRATWGATAAMEFAIETMECTLFDRAHPSSPQLRVHRGPLLRLLERVHPLSTPV